MVYRLLAAGEAGGVEAVGGDGGEAEEGEDEAEVDCCHGTYAAKVDDHGLERGHKGSAHDGHHEEGGAERGIAGVDAVEGYAVDGREHD